MVGGRVTRASCQIDDILAFIYHTNYDVTLFYFVCCVLSGDNAHPAPRIPPQRLPDRPELVSKLVRKYAKVCVKPKDAVMYTLQHVSEVHRPRGNRECDLVLTPAASESRKSPRFGAVGTRDTRTSGLIVHKCCTNEPSL